MFFFPSLSTVHTEWRKSWRVHNKVVNCRCGKREIKRRSQKKINCLIKENSKCIIHNHHHLEPKDAHCWAKSLHVIDKFVHCEPWFHYTTLFHNPIHPFLLTSFVRFWASLDLHCANISIHLLSFSGQFAYRSLFCDLIRHITFVTSVRS